MHQNYIGEPNSLSFSKVANSLRYFFLKRGFIEVHTQDRLSILAACEDPTTVATYQYAGKVWPLPQTGQMWLEYELLTRPDVPGVFCMSTSYRSEKQFNDGRHKILFPMFEFEARGNIEDLQNMEAQLLEHLGYGRAYEFYRINYEDATTKFGVKELEDEHEQILCNTFGRATFLERFPEHTSPFWNMKRNNDGTSNKIDVLMDGMETIGSAERENDTGIMRESFHTISNGEYAKKLFELFGEERVEKELEDFLSLPMCPRYGGGIGMTRLLRSIKIGEQKTVKRFCEKPIKFTPAG
ncbi:MAG: amino acid--tRNA ligase-related protein [Patescibacteria group bacterium]